MKEYIKPFLNGVMIAGVILIIIIFSMYFMYPEKKIIVLDSMRDYTIQNNLSVDFYNEINNKWASDYNITEFNKILNENYEYTKIKDCTYWAFIWALYFEKHNDIYNYKFVTLEESRFSSTHIFVIAWDSNGYYLADNNMLQRYDLE